MKNNATFAAVVLLLVLVVIPLGGAMPGEAGPVVQGTARKWQTITLRFAGPTAAQTDRSPNPFLDYRLDVTFSGPGARAYTVPGFFDGDGEGGPSGNAWLARFTPDAPGTWILRASFRRGTEVAVDSRPDAGSPAGPPDGATGEIVVGDRDPEAPGFLKWGRLEYAGKHYLKFRDGPWWIKGGTDDPEDFLGYRGFHGTPAATHSYAPHEKDWRLGDPDWGSGAGKGIIGALNYLSAEHVNSVYFLTLNIGGDGKNVWPFVGPIDPKGNPANDDVHYDVRKLREWEIVFAHAQRKGIVLHFVLNEAEAPNKLELDDATLGTERKLFYREIAARFAHHNALEWNLCEEYDLDLDLGPGRVKEFAGWLGSIDPYRHPITVHNQKHPLEAWAPFLGDLRFSLTSIQYHPGDLSYGDLVERLRERSRAAGRPIPVSIDEFDRAAREDHERRGKEWPFLSGHTRLRKGVLWPIYMSGGQVEFILENMLENEDFRPFESMWRYTWYARKFLEENVPFQDMEPRDGLLDGEAAAYGGGQVFALEGRTYAVYLPRARPSGVLDLSRAPGTFRKRWFDPRTGKFEGLQESVRGGSPLALGESPGLPEEDWVILLDLER